MTQVADDTRKNREVTVLTTEQSDEFKRLLGLKPRVKEFFPNQSDKEREAIETAIVSLITYIQKDDASVVPGNVVKTLDEIIAVLDKKLEDQINLIIHNENFQKLEGTWRGLYHLVGKTITDPMRKIKVMDWSKEELAEDMKTLNETTSFNESFLYKKVYTEGLGIPNADIFGCLIGDYHFDHSPADVVTLRGLSRVGAASQCPFIAGASPNTLGMASWTQLPDTNERLRNLVNDDFHKEWRSLRDSEDSRYIGLAMPRVMSRYPYTAGNPGEVKEFHFEEDTSAGDHSRYTWTNAAYHMAVCIMRAFAMDGFCTRISGYNSGGKVINLPSHTFKTDKRRVQTKFPTEIEIDQVKEQELSQLGMMPLLHWANTDYGAFVDAQSIQSPREYEGLDGDGATANAKLSAMMPEIFASCRFAHYLKRMVFESIGMYTSRDELEGWLQGWINNYIESNPRADAGSRARHPLRAAKVTVIEDERNPGYFAAQFELVPHIRLLGVAIMIGMVSRLFPKPK